MIGVRSSVVMTTYNGEKYIEEMLESIRNQTVSADEVLIFDDISKDYTVKIINEFIKKNNLTNWKVRVNEKNCGWKVNFFEGLKQASGDIIFLADQDDRWHNDKLEKVMDFFKAKENAWLIATQVNVFSDDGSEVEDMENVNIEPDGKVIFDNHYYVVKRPGCSMAMRKEILPFYFELWNSDMPHDAALWSISNLIGKLYILDEKLIDYRRHSSNVTNHLSHNVNQALNSAERTLLISKWYLGTSYADNSKTDCVKSCIKWCDYRSRLIRQKKLIYFFKLFRYRKHYSYFKRYLGDLYYFFAKLK